jgi:hypothetical protein
MLAVSSITANVRVAGRADVNVGIGPSESYAENLVPFSAGIAYEENPTISYTPVWSENYMRQMLSPIPLDLLVLIARSVTHPTLPITLMVSRINDIRNPDFLLPLSAEPDPRFARFLELMLELQTAGRVAWTRDPREEVEFDLVIHDYAPTYSAKVRELLALMELQMPKDESKDIVLPLSLAVKGKELGGIAITTRSVHDLIEILCASIDVPEEHTSSGLAVKYPPTGLAGKDIYIRRSEERPRHASVAVKYRGFWLYIDERDIPSKIAFRLITSLWAIRIATATEQLQAAPVLTIPVSR